MTLRTIFQAICCLLFLVSCSSFAVQISVQVHPEDDIFRNDAIRSFESKHVRDGVLIHFHSRGNVGDNVLMRYYAIINPPFMLNEKFIAELSKLAGRNLYVAMLNLGDIYSSVGLKDPQIFLNHIIRSPS